MSDPEQVMSRYDYPPDDAQAQANDEAIEIDADLLEHVAGGAVGGDGSGDN
jgi:hypothetical protein